MIEIADFNQLIDLASDISVQFDSDDIHDFILELMDCTMDKELALDIIDYLQDYVDNPFIEE